MPDESKSKPSNTDTKKQEPYRPVDGETNSYSRDELYSQIWNEPMTEVAKKYGVSDVAVRKACKKLNIPMPPRGYWAKKRAGQKVEMPPLPQLDGIAFATGYRSYHGTKKKRTSENTLDFLSPAERQKVLDIAQDMEAFKAFKLHPAVANYIDMYKSWSRQQSKVGYQLNKFYNNVYMDFFENISEEQLARTYKILSIFFYAVEESGGQINENMSLQIRGEYIRFEIHEIQNMIDHTISKDEEIQLQQYKSGKSYYPEPKIRKYDYINSGRLCVYIEGYKKYRDSKTNRLESMLGNLLIDAYEEAENQPLNEIDSLK